MPKKDEPALQGIALFSALDPEALRNLEMRCRWHRYRAKETILDRADEHQHDIFFVIQGSVRIVNYSAAGKEIAFANVRAGSYFGELAALTDSPRSASVVAITNCRLAAMSPAIFRGLLEHHPGMAIEVIQGLADIVQRCDQRIMDLSTLSAVQRVHVELLRLARPDVVAPENWVIRPFPTHSEIASHASTTRETVARALKQLSVAGVVERKGKALHIPDYERLTELVEGGAAQMVAAR